jgi:hypothetical protein
MGAGRLLELEAPLLAPDLMVVEATNAWWKKHRRREMDMIDVEQAVTNLLAAGISWTSSAELVRPAARLATELGHPFTIACIWRSRRLDPPCWRQLTNVSVEGRSGLGVRVWRATN